MREAREALTQVVQRYLAGEDVGGQRRKAETALVKAQAASREPWRERAEAGRRAVRDVDREIATVITTRFEELLAVLHEEGQAAAQRCNEALEQVITSYRAREATASRIDALAGTIRRPRFGDIELSRLERIAADAARLLESDGGERAPRLRHDPRQPRSASLPPQDSPYAAVQP